MCVSLSLLLSDVHHFSRTGPFLQLCDSPPPQPPALPHGHSLVLLPPGAAQQEDVKGPGAGDAHLSTARVRRQTHALNITHTFPSTPTAIRKEHPSLGGYQGATPHSFLPFWNWGNLHLYTVNNKCFSFVVLVVGLVVHHHTVCCPVIFLSRLPQ